MSKISKHNILHFDRIKSNNSARLTPVVLFSAFLFMTGCANQLATKSTVSTPQNIATEKPEIEKIYDRPFEADSLYALLVAEIAGNRSRLDIMLSNYVQQANKTRDPGVIQRASHIARYLNAQKPALDMALLWVDVEPDHSEAHLHAMAALTQANRLEEAFAHATFLLQHGEHVGLDAIGAKAASGDLNVTLNLTTKYKALLSDFPEDAGLHMGLSFLQQHAGDFDEALASARTAKRTSKDNFRASMQEIRLLQQLGETKNATDLMAMQVEKHPDNTRLRLQYARILTGSNLELAQEQFSELLARSPGDPDITLALGLIYFERGLYQEADQTLSQLLNHPRHQSTAHYYIATMAKSQQDALKAIEHFEQVSYGDDYLSAQGQLAFLKVDINQEQQALVGLKEQQLVAPEQYTTGLRMLEANVLVSTGQYTLAEDSFNQILVSHPDSIQTLYSRAMLYTNMDKLELAETDLKRVISLKPRHAPALNALGYTLADKTDRIEEAFQYISRAFSITPNDPAVMDSMGWVQFRLGNYDAALTQLRKAMSVMPDHEIAAHLGEVLWVMGVKSEALDVWRKGLSIRPDSPIIQQTLKRLNASLPQ